MTHRKTDSTDFLFKAAARVAQDPGFMASALKAYAGGELDFERLGHLLKADRNCIVKLALCRRPSTEASSFASDVLAVASASGVSAAAVANALRHVDALAALKEGAPAPLLAAARDHVDSAHPGEAEDS